MANSTLEKVRAEALNLPATDRAELAQDLVARDGPADADAEKAWDAEILRRLAEIDAGTAQLIDREEFSKRMRARDGERALERAATRASEPAFAMIWDNDDDAVYDRL